MVNLKVNLKMAFFYCSGSQSMIPGSTAEAISGNSREKQILVLHFTYTDLGALELRLSSLYFMKYG